MLTTVESGAVWAKIERALPFSAGTWDLTSLRVREAVGELDIIESGDSALVAEIVDYPTGIRAYRAIAGSGTWDDYDGMMAGLLAGAERVGASRIEIFGRPGWERRLKQVGFKRMFIALAKEV